MNHPFVTRSQEQHNAVPHHYAHCLTSSDIAEQKTNKVSIDAINPASLPSAGACSQTRRRRYLSQLFYPLPFFLFLIIFACPLTISCKDNDNNQQPIFSLREFLDYDVFPLDSAVW